MQIDVNSHWEKIPIKITVLAQYSCSIFIFLFISYCIQSKILYTVYKILYTVSNSVYRRLSKTSFSRACVCVCVCVKMLQELVLHLVLHLARIDKIV